VIAHRLGTIQRADEILILEEGHILEHDSRETLATNSAARFYSLLQTGLEGQSSYTSGNEVRA
jgi:ABC-type multidrug transport system fused ATPase/permease subunit